MSDTDDFVIVDRPDYSSEIAKLSDWLQPTAYHDQSSDFSKPLNAHVPGTGDWLGANPQYQQWHERILMACFASKLSLVQAKAS